MSLQKSFLLRLFFFSWEKNKITEKPDRVWRPVVSTSRNTLHLRSEGRNSLVGQDPIDVCHVQTYADKKVCRHMNLRARIRNVAKSPDKIAFSVSLWHQWDGSFVQFAHCEVHIGFGLVCSMHVCGGGSDQMYEHITVSTPDITVSCSSWKVRGNFWRKQRNETLKI